MTAGDLCPMCQRDDLGCAVRDEGSYCRAPVVVRRVAFVARRGDSPIEDVPTVEALARVRRLDADRRTFRRRPPDHRDAIDLADFLEQCGIDVESTGHKRKIVAAAIVAWGIALRRRYAAP